MVSLEKPLMFDKGGCRELTLYFSRSSLERGALMMTRRSLEGALK